MKSIKSCFILLFIVVNVLSASDIQISRQREGEHIIIAPEEFISLANQLADFYLDEFGIERIIVDQQDIFDQMNNGVADPQAIRDYLMIFLMILPYGKIALYSYWAVELKIGPFLVKKIKLLYSIIAMIILLILTMIGYLKFQLVEFLLRMYSSLNFI